MACGMLIQAVVDHAQLASRARDFAIAVARIARTLPDDLVARHAVSQLIRASASVAANYRATQLARSRKEFIARIGIVIEEADECRFWMEYLEATSSSARTDLAPLQDEGRQLLKIFVASRKTTCRNLARSDEPLAR